MDKEKIKRNANEIKEKADEIIEEAEKGNEKKEIYNEKSFLISNAILQDNLLQNYRLIFITSQSILIPLSALLVLSAEYREGLNLIFILPLIMIGLGMVYLWIKVAKNRGLYVSYWHMKLLKYENGNRNDKPFETFKEWQEKSQQEKIRELNSFDDALLGSKTRKRMEEWIPSGFIVLWLSILALTIYYFEIPMIILTIIVIGIPAIFFYQLLKDC